MAGKMYHISNRDCSCKYDFTVWCVMSPFVFLFSKDSLKNGHFRDHSYQSCFLLVDNENISIYDIQAGKGLWRNGTISLVGKWQGELLGEGYSPPRLPERHVPVHGDLGCAHQPEVQSPLSRSYGELSNRWLFHPRTPFPFYNTHASLSFPLKEFQLNIVLNIIKHHYTCAQLLGDLRFYIFHIICWTGKVAGCMWLS